MGKRHGGYTIIETMIFIMVSGLMFTMAVVLVGGRQKQVQFSQGVRDFESKLKDYMNDVATGYFPAGSGVNCTLASLSAGTFPTISSGGSGQGSSNDCVFVGKIIQFSPDIGGTASPDKLLVHSLAGRKRNASGGFVTDLDQANVSVVTPSGGNSVPNLTETYTLKWGIKVTKVSQVSNATYGSIGVVSTFGTVSGGGFLSGAQTVRSGAVDTTALGQTSDALVGIADGLTGLVSPSSGIVICLANDDDSRKASITIGSEGRDTTVKLKVDDYEVAICGA